MLPRNPADYRSLLWALAMPVVLIAQFRDPGLLPYLAPVSFYFAMAAGAMFHNHVHCPTFSSRRMNRIYANWLSIFWGNPTFAWVPVHNLLHHKHVNREGEPTITWRHTNRNLWYVAVTHFFVSAYYQAPSIKEYVQKVKQANPRLYRQIFTQKAVWSAVGVGTLTTALVLHGPWVGLEVWALTIGLPSLFGPWSMSWWNYIHHVHCDPWSKYDHSRNFYGYAMNFLLFNVGFHTVHHAKPGAHWSILRAEHAKIADKIHPELKWRSFWWWTLRAYVIPAFIPRLETKQIGRAPFDRPDGGPAGAARSRGLHVDSVVAADAGINAEMT